MIRTRTFAASIVLALSSIVLLIDTSALASDRAGTWRAPREDAIPPAVLRTPDLDVIRPARAGDPVPTDPRDGRRRENDSRELPVSLERATINGYDEVGGDDVVFGDLYYLANTEMDIATNGDIYLGVGNDVDDPFREFIQVFRSTDGGDSFDLIGTFDGAGMDYDRLYDLYVVEGTVDRVFITYMHMDDSEGNFEMRVAFAPLGVASPTWTVRVVMDEPGVSYLGPDLAFDDIFFSEYYVYAVCAGLDGNGDDVWYARSTDQGNTWSAPYRIAELTSSGNLMYSSPHIEYGPGGELHLAYEYTERLQSTFDDGIYYRKATNYGSSPTDWNGTVWQIFSIGDGTDDVLYDVNADPTSSVVSVLRVGFGPSNPKVFSSPNGGDSWAIVDRIDVPLLRASESIVDAGRLVVVGTVDGGPDTFDRPAFTSAPMSDLRNWDTPRHFGEYSSWSGGRPAIARDTSRSPGLAFSFTANTPGPEYQVAFDAQWRTDDGYPNYEDGFPIDIPGGGVRERTAPAVADLEGDGTMEIVFANRDGNVYVVEHDGTVAPGWPVDVGALGSAFAAVAVGDLHGDGGLEIVVGTDDGRVVALQPDGDVLEGFPVDLGTDAATFVAIGALGAPYPNWILALSGDEQARINYRGLTEFKSGTLTGTATVPPAIGDVDGDGDTEIVYAFQLTGGGTGFQVLNGDLLGGVQAFRTFPETVSDGVSMGDIDRDGDLEIAVPTSTGRLYVMHHDMSDVTGFPYDDPTASPLTRVAIDQILGNSPLELMFAAREFSVTILYDDATVQSSFPASTGSGWYLYGGPIVTSVDSQYGNSVIIGSRDKKAWSFRNVGATQAPGWPKPLDDEVDVSPAAADIDADGRNEVVFLGNDRLHVVDVGFPSNPNIEWWRMDGADAARTGCADCDTEIVTSVESSSDGSTGVDFRIASANPASSQMRFDLSLARPGVVELTIFDVRGRQVRRVDRSELAPGTHALTFDGRDARGNALASGTYFARLRVGAEGGTVEASRKFAWID